MERVLIALIFTLLGAGMGACMLMVVSIIVVKNERRERATDKRALIKALECSTRPFVDMDKCEKCKYCKRIETEPESLIYDYEEEGRFYIMTCNYEKIAEEAAEIVEESIR